MGELECDGACGEHDEREGGVGGVEAVGASDDEPALLGIDDGQSVIGAEVCSNEHLDATALCLRYLTLH